MPERPKRFLARGVFVADIGATLWWLLSLDIFGVDPPPFALYRYGLISVVFLAFLLAFAPHTAVVNATAFAALVVRLAEFAGMLALVYGLACWLLGWTAELLATLMAFGGAALTMLAIHVVVRLGIWLIERRSALLGGDPRESWSRIMHIPQPVALFSPITADSSQPAVTYAAQRAKPAPSLRFQTMPEPAVADAAVAQAAPSAAALAAESSRLAVARRPSALTPTQRLVKRTFDLVVCTLALVALTPVLLVIGLLVRLDSPGPALFRQQRLGKHGALFPMIKFRSMCVDAEQRWREVSQRDEQGRLIHKTSSDPRVTSLGRLLRRTSIDELPQLINVLRGEMSLVGPRPEMPYMLGEYAPWQLERFEVTPGITGWWQINGRGDRLMHLHTEDDIYYIRNYSFWLDVKILWKTIGVVARSDGAF